MPFDGKLDEIGEILMRAADLIEERGHTKHVQVDEEGRLCLHGALSIAIYGSANAPERFDVNERLYSFAPHAANTWARTPGLKATYYEFATWNNMPSRTGKEVIDLLRGAARHKVPETV